MAYTILQNPFVVEMILPFLLVFAIVFAICSFSGWIDICSIWIPYGIDD